MHPNELLSEIPGLRRYARALTGDAWAADDLVQDTLERACTKHRLWREGTDLRAWLFTLMHNLYMNQLQRVRRQNAAGREVDVDDSEAELIAPALPTDTALDLQRCLLLLPEEQREVLLLVTLEDLSYKTVARITGVPEGTVMSRLSRARHRLQALMDGAPAAAGLPRAAEPVPLRRLK